MRYTDVKDWKTFKEWVTKHRHPKLAGYFSDYFFHEMGVIALAPMRGEEVLHVDVEVCPITLISLAGPNPDRLRRLRSYTFLHENAWKVIVTVQTTREVKGTKCLGNGMSKYTCVFLRDTDGKLVYSRAYDENKGMPLWNMTALAKLLTKE
jgi:hypothetical protein